MRYFSSFLNTIRQFEFNATPLFIFLIPGTNWQFPTWLKHVKRLWFYLETWMTYTISMPPSSTRNWSVVVLTRRPWVAHFCRIARSSVLCILPIVKICLLLVKPFRIWEAKITLRQSYIIAKPRLDINCLWVPTFWNPCKGWPSTNCCSKIWSNRPMWFVAKRSWKKPWMNYWALSKLSTIVCIVWR